MNRSDWLLLHAGALGDLALTLGMLLRHADFASRGGTIVSRVDPGDLADCRPPLRRLSSDGRGLHWLFGDGGAPPPAALSELVRGRRVVNALQAPQSQTHARLLQLCPAELFSFDPKPLAGDQRHIVAQWCAALAGQGLAISPDAAEPLLEMNGRSPLPETAARPQSKPLHRPARGGVLLHPGSGGRSKCWPIDSYAALARAFAARQQSPAFLIGPAELERFSAAERAQLAAAAPLHCELESGGLLRRVTAARLYIGNDSGPTHWAALLGTPTLAIFGASSPQVWRPCGRCVTVIEGDARVSPSWGIDVDAVLRAAESFV